MKGNLFSLAKCVLVSCIGLSISLTSFGYTSHDRNEIQSLKRQVYQLNKRIDQLSGANCPTTQHPYGDPNDQTWPRCCQNPCKPQNHVWYIKHNFPYFYDIVTYNAPKSRADNNLCLKGMLCFSLLANMDLNWSERRGGAEAGILYGVGVRPMFGNYDTNLIGSINNLDLFVDGALNNWITAHIDLVYLNGNRKTACYDDSQKDFGSAYRSAAALKVQEGYFLVANPAVTPFYLKIGRYISEFGTFENPYAITPTLPQLISQDRTGGVVFGAVLNNGIYGSVFWQMAEQSLDNLNGDDSFVFTGPNKDRNYGAKLGIKSCYSGLNYHLNAAYVADIIDADYIKDLYNVYNHNFHDLAALSFVIGNQYIIACRASGMSLHADFEYCGFGLSGNYVKALSGINPDPTIKCSKISAYDVTGYVKFPVFGCASKFELSYQGADDSYIYQTFEIPFLPPGFFPIPTGNILPDTRFSATYKMNIFHQCWAYLQWVHDCDFCVGDIGGGTDRTSNFISLRIGGEF